MEKKSQQKTAVTHVNFFQFGIEKSGAFYEILKQLYATFIVVIFAFLFCYFLHDAYSLKYYLYAFEQKMSEQKDFPDQNSIEL